MTGGWDDEAIEYLHSIGHCFVTLTRAEGHGLGACHAALRGKHVIVSEYGGQTGYLKEISWVPCKETPAYLCSPFDSTHKKCLDQPGCRFFAYFIATQQKWGDPDARKARQLMGKAKQNRSVGDTRTVRYLTSRFNMETVGKQFIDFVMSSVFLKKGSRVLYPRVGMENTYDVSEEMLLPLRHFVPQAPLSFFPKRPRLLIVGAGYLGNFGDDRYFQVHQRQLSEKFDLLFCNTTTFLNPEGTLKSLSDYRKGTPVVAFDHLTKGGGGLINKGELNSCIFKVYFPYCKANGVPLSFTSVGFGYQAVEDESKRALDQQSTQVWSEILEYAESISVRSHADMSAVLKMISPARHHRVR